MERTLTTSGLMGGGNVEVSCSFTVGMKSGECKEIEWSKRGLQLRKQRTLVSRTRMEQEAVKGLTY